MVVAPEMMRGMYNCPTNDVNTSVVYLLQSYKTICNVVLTFFDCDMIFRSL
jgi:hypothetical protein